MLALFAAALAGWGAQDEERVNVALRRWGLSSARGSSSYGQGYEAGNVLDGRWQRRETDKWNTATGANPPHWLVIDLGAEFAVDRIVIRHEGVFGEGDRYDTGDFRLEKGAAGDGPWTPLCEPIRGNREDVTTHDIPLAPLRYLRLCVDVGEQGGRNEYARIFEVEVPVLRSRLTAPLCALEWAGPARLRKAPEGGIERLAALDVVLPEGRPAGVVEVLWTGVPSRAWRAGTAAGAGSSTCRSVRSPRRMSACVCRATVGGLSKRTGTCGPAARRSSPMAARCTWSRPATRMSPGWTRRTPARPTAASSASCPRWRPWRRTPRTAS
jgi:hypothetical protein